LMGALFFSMKISAGSDHIFVDFFFVYPQVSNTECHVKCVFNI
jgi:hypothetical protein